MFVVTGASKAAIIGELFTGTNAPGEAAVGQIEPSTAVGQIGPSTAVGQIEPSTEVNQLRGVRFSHPVETCPYPAGRIRWV